MAPAPGPVLFAVVSAQDPGGVAHEHGAAGLAATFLNSNSKFGRKDSTQLEPSTARVRWPGDGATWDKHSSLSVTAWTRESGIPTPTQMPIPGEAGPGCKPSSGCSLHPALRLLPRVCTCVRALHECVCECACLCGHLCVHVSGSA